MFASEFRDTIRRPTMLLREGMQCLSPEERNPGLVLAAYHIHSPGRIACWFLGGSWMSKMQTVIGKMRRSPRHRVADG